MNQVNEFRVTLVLLAHYDDEIFCLPLLNQAFIKNTHIKFIWLTNSCGRNRVHVPEKRKRETMRFLHTTIGKDFNFETIHLGISQGVDDLKLHENLSDVARQILNQFKKIDNIICPTWENGHTDHDSSYLISKFIQLERNCDLLSVPMYSKASKFFPFNVMKLLNQEVENIKVVYPYGKIFLHYFLIPYYFRSQLRSWIGLYPFIIFRVLLTRKSYYLREKVSLKELKFYTHSLIQKRDIKVYNEWKKKSIDFWNLIHAKYPAENKNEIY